MKTLKRRTAPRTRPTGKHAPARRASRPPASPVRSSHELSSADLRRRFDDGLLEPDLVRIAPAQSTVGQERAVRALRTGLEIPQRGFNIFVTGPDGTGRSTTVKAVLEEARKTPRCEPRDRVYVNNFKDADRPRLLVMPKGCGRRLRKDMEALLTRLRSDLPAVLESEEFKKTLAALSERFRKLQSEGMREFEQKIRKHNFMLGEFQLGVVSVPDLVPLVKGKPAPIEKLEEMAQEGAISEKELASIRTSYESLRGELHQLLRRTREAARDTQAKIAEMERELCDRVISGHIEDLRREYPEAAALEYFGEVHRSLLEDLALFKPSERESGGGGALVLPFGGGPSAPPPDPFLPYRVNVVLDTSERPACPLEIPDTPTYVGLFGAIEIDIFRSGALHTDFTRIRGGALLRADGGYLVLNARDILSFPGAWPALKRVLKTGRLDIALPEGLLLTPATAMRPEPIDLDVKVVLIGEGWIYDLLYVLDDEFTKIFKIKAEFDHEMRVTPENLRHFVSVIAKVGTEEKLPPLSGEAAAEIVRHAVRGAHRRTHISTRFNDVADLYREAAQGARGTPGVGGGGSPGAAAGPVTAGHVRAAIEALRNRHNLPEEKLQEAINEGLFAIEVEGERIGQVNGLAVYDLGQHLFGRPSRITATVALGRAGILNLEREVGLSGRIHDKGVFILSAFLRHRFGQRIPLALTATLCFEQSYAGVEGDSASSTELYALLSALADAPITQGIAVTGSVDQRGRVQPIGGANQKVEGFFDVCRAKGLTGGQGVLLPRTNVEDLMLREEVIEAVESGRFHLWAVSTIDEGIEILTGVPAGAPGRGGAYSPRSINGRVERRLREMARRLTRFEKGK
ncbi:MAG: AAA family ATPase [Planctomycetes bacterium]|nr:AAA family ATPase [Planctomycetota bacterium]